MLKLKIKLFDAIENKNSATTAIVLKSASHPCQLIFEKDRATAAIVEKNASHLVS